MFSCTLYFWFVFANFDGVRIYVHDFDHPPPHFHAYHAEHQVVIVIETLEIYAGNMPNRKLNRIKKWAAKNKEQLVKEFETKNPQQQRNETDTKNN